jgi:4-hydroxy-2-oxoheptanedioate aldolase
LKLLWKSGRAALGGWCSIPSSFSAEIVASIGFDYVCVDLQHGLADFGDMLTMLQAIALHGPAPLVRIPYRDLGVAQRALDAGAEGLIFPLVDSVEDARAAVACCRYPPAGERSFGPIRSRLVLGPDPDHANAEIACIVMIETSRAVANLEAILDCPGVDAVYIGPNDLALALGLPPGTDDPRLSEAIGSILKVCQSKGMPAGVHTSSAAAAARALQDGFAMATLSTDAAILAAAYGAERALVSG